MIYTVENTAKIGKPVAVYVNGKKVENVISVDTEKGEVIVIPEPIKKKWFRDEFRTKKIRGSIKVEFI